MIKKNNQKKCKPYYPIVHFNQEFYKEIQTMEFGNNKSGKVIAIKYHLGIHSNNHDAIVLCQQENADFQTCGNEVAVLSA